MKVLVSAYACEPGRGSEPEVGWQTSTHLAQIHEVTVLTRANNRPLIEQGLATLQGTHPSFIYYDLPGWLLWLKKRGMGVIIYYFLWQIGARLHMRGKLEPFDLIHHCTFNSFRQPGFWWLTKKAVVLGPLGGGQICPWGFLPWFRKQLLFEIFRSLTVLCGYILPQILTSLLSARRILIANEDTLRRIPWFFRAKTLPMLETAVSPEQIIERTEQPRSGPPRFLWISRLDKLKGAELAVRAFALAVIENPEIRLTMGGAGPEEKPLQALIKRLGISHAIDWRGRIPKEEVTSVMASHDAFLFTSLRDTSGNVMLEAMAAGMPVIAFAHHGALEISTQKTALQIPVTSSRETITAMKEAILRIAADPALARRLGIAGQQRVKEMFTWKAQAVRLDKVFQSANEEQQVLDKLQKNTFEALFSIRGVFFTLVIAMFIALVEFGVVRTLQSRTDSIVKHTLPRLSHIADANALLTETFSNTVMAVHSDDPAEQARLIAKVQDLSPKTTAALTAYEQLRETGHEDPVFQQLLSHRSKYLTARANAFTLLQDGQRAEALAVYKSKVTPSYEAYQRAGDMLLQANIQEGAGKGASLIWIFRITEIALVLTTIIIFVFGFTVGFSR